MTRRELIKPLFQIKSTKKLTNCSRNPLGDKGGLKEINKRIFSTIVITVTTAIIIITYHTYHGYFELSYDAISVDIII